MFGKQTRTINSPKIFSLAGSKVGGETFISINALESIASLAVKDIKGVLGLKGGVFERANSIINRNAQESEGVSVVQNSDGSLNFVISVVIEFGVSIPKVAIKIQEAVKNAVNESTDLVVKNVDLVVDSYVSKKEIESKK